jgi:redox-sensitive bicupin YhaK (pirin superfamily)
MMIELRKGSERKRTQMDWLESRHSFSFGHHYDPSNLGYGPLRVINEDWIAPRSGFPDHPHRDMEILTYMLAGTLTHRDSEGNAVEIKPGRLQAMRAGSGIAHSEMNLDEWVRVHLLQIWIEPDALGLEPGHVEFDFDRIPGTAVVLASKDGKAGGVSLQQDASVSSLTLGSEETFTLPVDPVRRTWIQFVRGDGRVGQTGYEAGDAITADGVNEVVVEGSSPSEMLIFDLP